MGEVRCQGLEKGDGTGCEKVAVHAAMHTARLALKMNRNLLVREQRSRLLLAVRQTYNDFFHDHYVTTRHVFQLRVGHPAVPADP